jgi:predicted MFS family arabinose efflux permease
VWTLQLGGLVSAYGGGMTYPFLIIYLDSVRGFGLDTAGFVVAASGVAGICFSPFAGTIVDRLGGRLTLAGALLMLAVGYGALAFVREPWQAVLAVIVAGFGNGSFWPSQSALLAGLTPPARRHAAYAMQRVTRNLGIGLGGLTGGLIATTSDPGSFTVLFLVDALTFVAFALVLPLVADPELPPRDPGARGGYLDVLRDRLMLGLFALNAGFVAAGYAVFGLLPAFAEAEAGVSTRLIGVIFLLNTLVVVFAQMPVARALEGHRRMRALALMTAVWAVAWLVVLAGGTLFEAGAAAAVFILAGMVFGLGECFQGPTQGALVADLAPPRLRGRYMAVSTMSWDVGFIIGPAAGGLLLDREPFALWPVAAAVCLLAGAGCLLLERSVPPELRVTPA